MEAIARFQGGVKFEISARGHKVICDQPPANGGADEGMTPPEFLLGSLASCAGFYAAQYLKARGLPAAGLEVRVSAEKALKPARLASFRIELALPELDRAHEEGLVRAAKACLIHHTLETTPQIEFAVLTASPTSR
jgi:putative redox protein